MMNAGLVLHAENHIANIFKDEKPRQDHPVAWHESQSMLVAGSSRWTREGRLINTFRTCGYQTTNRKDEKNVLIDFETGDLYVDTDLIYSNSIN